MLRVGVWVCVVLIAGRGDLARVGRGGGRPIGVRLTLLMGRRRRMVQMWVMVMVHAMLCIRQRHGGHQQRVLHFFFGCARRRIEGVATQLREARGAHADWVVEVLRGQRRAVFRTVCAEYITTIPAVVFPPAQPENSITSSATCDGVIRHPEGRMRRDGAIHKRAVLIHSLPGHITTQGLHCRRLSLPGAAHRLNDRIRLIVSVVLVVIALVAHLFDQRFPIGV